MDISTTLPKEVAEDWQLSLKEPLKVSLKLSNRRITLTLLLNHSNNNHNQNEIVTNYLKEIIEVQLSEQLKGYQAIYEKTSLRKFPIVWKRYEGKTFFDSLVAYVKTRLSNCTKVF